MVTTMCRTTRPTALTGSRRAKSSGGFAERRSRASSTRLRSAHHNTGQTFQEPELWAASLHGDWSGRFSLTASMRPSGSRPGRKHGRRARSCYNAHQASTSQAECRRFESRLPVSPVGFEPTTRGLKVSLGAVHGVIWAPFLSMPRGASVHWLHTVRPTLMAVAVNVAVNRVGSRPVIHSGTLHPVAGASVISTPGSARHRC